MNKQENTLEEAAEREASLFYEKGSLDWNKYRQVFIEGAKRQQQNRYSEEKVIELIQFLSMNEEFNGYSSVTKETAKHFLEQFKKK